MATKKVPLAAIVEDLELYPRVHVDSVHVADLVRAIQAGAILPPLVIDLQSKRVVDGWHRRRAWLKVLGETGEIEVDLRRFKSEADLFLAAVELNAAHGRKLDRQDEARIVNRARELAIADEVIATNLHVPPQRIARLAVRVVYDAGGQFHPAKRGMRSFEGTKLTRKQIAVVASVRSGDPVQPARELVKLLNAGLVDWSNPRVVAVLQELAEALRRQTALDRSA